jgi:hypothetical protein
MSDNKPGEVSLHDLLTGQAHLRIVMPPQNPDGTYNLLADGEEETPPEPPPATVDMGATMKDSLAAAVPSALADRQTSTSMFHPATQEVLADLKKVDAWYDAQAGTANTEYEKASRIIDERLADYLQLIQGSQPAVVNAERITLALVIEASADLFKSKKHLAITLPKVGTSLPRPGLAPSIEALEQLRLAWGQVTQQVVAASNAIDAMPTPPVQKGKDGKPLKPAEAGQAEGVAAGCVVFVVFAALLIGLASKAIYSSNDVVTAIALTIALVAAVYVGMGVSKKQREKILQAPQVRGLLAAFREMDELAETRLKLIAALGPGFESTVRARASQETAEQDAIRRGRIAEAQAEWLVRRKGVLPRLAAIGRGFTTTAPQLHASDGSQWQPAESYPPALRIGTITWPEANDFAVPVLLDIPRALPFGILTEGPDREPATHALEMLLLKLLIHTPPGKIRFTLIDAVGRGQAFSSFMHLVDNERREKANEEAIGRRIWTEPGQIEERLAELTNEMEMRIQQRLGKRFADIHEYNAQAVAPLPWIIVGIANFPNGFSSDASRRVRSIAEHGARTGIYLAITRNINEKLPAEARDADFKGALSLGIMKNGKVEIEALGRTWKIDPDYPEPGVIEPILERLAVEIPQGSIVQVPFADMRPAADAWMTSTTRDSIAVPIGLSGARKRQLFELSNERSAYHGVVVGQTGAGKSMLLHVLILNLALTYSPDELELYLIDFKEGVEFKMYAEKQLPHARVIAIRSEPEFGLSVLEGLAAELARRGELFRKTAETLGEVKDLASYRARTGEKLPRILLIIDEFQVMTAEDNALSRRVAQVFELIARQGRSAGIHLLLVSQTLTGSSALSEATLGQLSLRIALRCTEADAALLFSDDNPGPRDLTRPGEALYNDGNGKIEANSAFQVAYLDRQAANLESTLDDIARLAAVWRTSNGAAPLPLKVFEGDADADLTECRELAAAMVTGRAGDGKRTQIWLGEPLSIKDATAASLRRQSRSNLLIVGQDQTLARGMLEAVALSIAAQQRDTSGLPPVTVIDTTPVDDEFATRWQDVAEYAPDRFRVASRRAVPVVIDDLYGELARRETSDLTAEPLLTLIVHGVSRARDLQRAEDAAPGPDDLDTGAKFAKLIRNGPEYGIHVIAWSDTLASLARMLDRRVIDEFDQRVAMQMSVDDSNQLVDSPAASKLGEHRAMLFVEESARLEKFRPFGMTSTAALRNAPR